MNRRKIATYGKTTRRNDGPLFAEEDMPATSKSGHLKSRSISEVNKTAATAPTMTLKSPRKLVPPSPKKSLDVFDFPSDDERDPYRAASSNPAKKSQLITKPRTNLRAQFVEASTSRVAKRKRDSLEKAQQMPKSPIKMTKLTSASALSPKAQVVTPAMPRPNQQREQLQLESPRLKETKRTQLPMSVTSPVRKSFSPRKPQIALARAKDGEGGDYGEPLTTDTSASSHRKARIPLEIMHNRPQTPPQSYDDSIMHQLDEPITITPRQRSLWDRLLEEPGLTGSPGIDDLDKLHRSHSANMDTDIAIDTPQTTKSRPSRLVDTLKDLELEEASSDSEETVLSQSHYQFGPLQYPDDEQSVVHDSQPPIKSSRPTYARGTRTYLEDQNEDDLLELLGQEFGTPLNKNPEKAPVFDEGLESEDDSQSKQPRSVHDLRAAGARRRLVDELESLVDELSVQSQQSMGPKRATLVDLGTKLLQKDSIICFMDCGLDRKLLEYTASLTDTVSNIMIAVILALIAEESSHAFTLREIWHSKCLRNVTSLLGYDGNISRVVKDRKSNMSKVAQSSVLDFAKLVRKSFLWDAKVTTLSPRLMALKTMDILAQQLRQMGNKEVLLDEDLVKALLSTCSCSSGTPEGVEGTNILQSQLALSILISTFSVESGRRISWNKENLGTLADLTTQCLLAPANEEQASIELLVLKTCLNVTNRDHQICDLITKDIMIEALLQSIGRKFHIMQTSDETQDRESLLESLILTLGFLLNLTELSPDAQQSISAIQGDPARVHILSTVVNHFIYGQSHVGEADSLQAAQDNIPYGWLAVVLGDICQVSATRAFVRHQLPGNTLVHLLEAIDGFISIIQTSSQEELAQERDQTVANDFVGRLKAVPQRLRNLERLD